MKIFSINRTRFIGVGEGIAVLDQGKSNLPVRTHRREGGKFDYDQPTLTSNAGPLEIRHSGPSCSKRP